VQRARADREARGRRRARLVAARLAVALAFAASAGGYAIIKQRQADSRQRQAQRAALAADASRLGALARASGDYDRALLLAAQAVKLNPSPTTESDVFATLLHDDSVVATLRGPQSIESAGFSPDDSAVIAVDSAGDLLRWSTRGGPAQTLLDLGNQAMKIAVAADGSLVVSYWSSSGVPTLGVLDPSGKRFLARIPNFFQLPEQSFVLSQDRRQVIFLHTFRDTPSSVVRIWRIGAPRSAIRQVDVGSPVWQVAACGPATACAWTDGVHIVRIRLSDATVEGQVTLPPDVRDFAASPDGRLLAIARPDGVIRLVDARTGAVRQILGGAFRDPHPLVFSPDGREVVAADFDSLLVWRVGRAGLPERHDVFGGRINFATWSGDGSTLSGGGRGGTVVLLDRTGRRGVGTVITDALTDDTTTLWAVPGAIVVGQFGGKVVFVDPSSGAVHAVDGPVRDPAHQPLWMHAIETARAGRDGRLVVTTNTHGDTAVWDVASHRLRGTVDLPAPPYFLPGTVPQFDPDVWVSPDGRQAATIRTCAGPIVFDPVTRRVLRHLPPLPGLACGFEVVVQGWTPDGHSILITRQLSATHSELLVIDATTGAVKLRVGTGAAGAAEASEDPAGRFIALAMRDGMLQILDAKDGHPLAPPQRANDGQVLNVSISPDGRYIATAGEPPSLNVWDTRTFRQVGIPLPLDVNASYARTRFAPDGRLVVADGSTLKAFTIDPAAWLARACQEARRILTRTEFEEVLPGQPYRPACA
jgi:WD40 repeat protein